MTDLTDTFTSTGSKLLWHKEAMQGLRDGKPRVVTAHIMPTDICAHSCAFCSVGQRAGDVLPIRVVLGFVETLKRHGLLSVIVSGGGNPILYKCPESGATFNDLIGAIHEMGLQIGIISDGMPLRLFDNRESWGTVRPETLDKLTWLRISMAGLDHDEQEVYVPDIDPKKTTLGFSYIAHDIFHEPADPYHGKVSHPLDLISGDKQRKPDLAFKSRIDKLVMHFVHYVKVYRPRYVRLLPNCLEPSKISLRCKQLECMADEVNGLTGRDAVFVQYKPPAAPHACYNGYLHPTLAPDSFVYSCDSVVLAAADIGYKSGKPNHTFDSPWRLCRWDEVEDRLFKQPVSSLVDSQRLCAGCVFHTQQKILEGVVDGTLDLTPPTTVPEHSAFI
jgi:hypothetical protein